MFSIQKTTKTTNQSELPMLPKGFDAFSLDAPSELKTLYTFTCAADNKKYKTTEREIIEKYSQKENGVPNKFFPVKVSENGKVSAIGEPLYRTPKPVNTNAQIYDQNSRKINRQLEHKRT